MKSSAFLTLLTLSMLLPSTSIYAEGVSPYLPLNLAPEVELQIEKLMAMTGSTPLTKPYKAKELLNRLEEIKEYHPLMYRRLSSYLRRYTRDFSNTHRAIILSAGNENPRALDNNRGVKHNANIEISGAGHVFINPYVYLSLGASYSDDGGRAATNTHFTFGNEYIQADLGFRDHWFSPFHDSAMLFSTQAENTPSVTLSNSTGLTDFNIHYEMFYTKMDDDVQVTGIGVPDHSVTSTGEPSLMGLHLSFAPLENLSVGFSRTYFYGGGIRDDGLSVGLSGLLTPSSLEETLLDNLEQGYGQSAISAKWSYGKEMPVALYSELARFDSDSFSNLPDSGNAISLGLHLPILFENMSFRYEFTDRDDGWYQSSFYPEGFSHKQHVLGHWSADQLLPRISPGSISHHVLMDWELIDDQLLAIKLSHQSFDHINDPNLANLKLDNSFQLKARYSFVTRFGFMGFEGTVGNDVLGENYNRISAFYRW